MAVLSDIAVPALAIACTASALYRLAVLSLARRHPRNAPGGPDWVLAILSLFATLFLAVPATLVWGLFLAGALAIWHIAQLWKSHPA